MTYIHPFYKKEYDVVIGETLFFNYITFKISDAQYETFVFDDDTGKMFPITKIIENVILTDNQQAALTTNKRQTEELWKTLKIIGDKELTQKFASFVNGDNGKDKSVLDWLKLFRKKNDHHRVYHCFGREYFTIC